MSVRVSVVMPVYNAGKYLSAAIKSVLAQTMPDFELVVVDDGSTDGSGDACDGFAALDSRVRVIHQQNAGICRARNAGIAASSGEWIAFCDHDDVYMPRFLELATATADAVGCQVVKVAHTVECRHADGRVKLLWSHCMHGVQDGPICVPELRSANDFGKFKCISTYVWDGLYARGLVDKCAPAFDERFKAGGEDIDFMLRLLSMTDRIGWVGQVLYRHFRNAGTSTSVRYCANKIDAALWNAELMASLFPASGTAVGARIDDRIKSLFHFCFEHPDCPLSVCEESEIVKRLFALLAPGDMRIDGGGRLLWVASHGWFRTYVVLKSLARKVRKARGSLFRRARPACF